MNIDTVVNAITEGDDESWKRKALKIINKIVFEAMCGGAAEYVKSKTKKTADAWEKKMAERRKKKQEEQKKANGETATTEVVEGEEAKEEDAIVAVEPPEETAPEE